MALKHCSMAEMASLSRPWSTPGHPERAALSRVSTVAALMPEIDEAHQELLKTYWATVDYQSHVTELNHEAQGLDYDHDSIIRAIHHVLRGHYHMNLLSGGDAALAERLDDLHARMYPTGLQIVQASYREEAGQGALLAARLTDEDKALLASIPVAGGNLLDQVYTWMHKAERLGAIEDLRDSSGAHNPPTASDARRARNRWIRVIKAMLMLIELAGVEDPEILAIVERVHEVARQAEPHMDAGDAVAEVEPAAEPETVAGAGAQAEPEPDMAAGAGAQAEPEPDRTAGFA